MLSFASRLLGQDIDDCGNKASFGFYEIFLLLTYLTQLIHFIFIL